MRRVAQADDQVLSLAGQVRTGLGQGAGFTALDWARAQFLEHCGIDPHPGTLNIVLEDPGHRATWAAMRRRPAPIVRPPTPEACDATLYPVAIGGSNPLGHAHGLTGAVVLPDVDGYPDDQLEIIAAVNLREHFGLSDGASLDVELQRRVSVTSVVFDVDGTLLNSLDGYCLAASRATERYGYEVTIEHVRHALNSCQPFWDFVIPDDEPKDDERIAELRDATMRHWPDALAEVVSVLPGIPEALERLRSAGVRLGIYTGSTGESFPPLRDAGLLDLFEVIVTANDVERRKPDPEGIVHCIGELGVSAADAAYVGDSRADIRASLAAGVTAIGVLTGAGDSASLATTGAHRVSEHAGGVPGLLDLGDDAD